MGSTYAVGLKSSAHYDAGYKAAAKYINASTDEIGPPSLPMKINFTNFNKFWDPQLLKTSATSLMHSNFQPALSWSSPKSTMKPTLHWMWSFFIFTHDSMTVPRVWLPPALSKYTCGWLSAGNLLRASLMENIDIVRFNAGTQTQLLDWNKKALILGGEHTLNTMTRI